MTTDYKAIIKEALQTSALNMTRLAESQKIISDLEKAALMTVESYKKGGSIFACGNGGSAADAQHFIAELVVKLSKDRTPIKGIALTVDSSVLTAIGNDFGYDWCFHRQVMALMGPNDILLAITTSGNSPNILHALEACQKIGCKSILLTGRDGGKALALADHAIIAPGTYTGNIQEAHLAIYHTLCFLIEKGLVEAGICQYQQSYSAT